MLGLLALLLLFSVLANITFMCVMFQQILELDTQAKVIEIWKDNMEMYRNRELEALDRIGKMKNAIKDILDERFNSNEVSNKTMGG